MYLLESILLLYFGYVSGYSFLLSLGGLFYKEKKAPKASETRKIAVLIPSYKEDKVIVGVAEDALRQNYPAECFDVVVIADSLRYSTLERLRALPIKVIEVSFEKSTKVKALNRAMEVLGDDYDFAVILDADNMMERNFLSKLNNLFALGYHAIQGRRDPKNQNTSMALLDGLSETINNFIYRQGTVSLGMSASLNGSGMAFEYGIYKQIMAGMDSIGGFDRELELKLIERNIKVYFAKSAIVYDEKVENTEVFERQRRRWISSQFFYLKKYFGPGCVSLLKGNFSFFNSAVLRNIQLPRLLNLGLLTVFTGLSFLLGTYLIVSSPWTWFALWSLSVLAMAFAIPPKFYSIRLLKSILLVPAIFVKMFLLLFKLKGANRTFIHTPHGAHMETQPSNVEKV
jgi:cellulose synthase/poly-beta-1,6-N-acetylglucosamine synthase-like glycosyltransferase